MINVKPINVTVLDFNSIFNKHIETNLINDLDKFGLIKDGKFNISKRDVKKFFYHHIIYGLSTFFLESKIKNKCIIFYTNLLPIGKDISHMTNNEDLQVFLNKTVIKISKLLPLRWYFADSTFDILTGIIKKNTGDSSDLIYRIKHAVDQRDSSMFTYTKAKVFAARYDLTFLTNNFFKKVYAKQLILR